MYRAVFALFKTLKVQCCVLSGAFLVTRLRSRLSDEVFERWRLSLAKVALHIALTFAVNRPCLPDI